MNGYIGEYNCRLDEKGRLSLPAKLRAQFPESAGNVLVVNRGFEKCLVLYTREDWMKETAKLTAVDDFMSPEIRRFKRLFTNGANAISLDTAQRILIPKKLLDYAEITDDVVLSANGSKVEIWSAKNYESEMAVDSAELSQLAQQFYTQQEVQRKTT
ncbi:MAG: division/cell wall cluster transcriptional repressor MraZ [Bacteroidetes bacterium]|nr:division/cell wall cluster transcriptional repressor MraZ [Bacteroidota bacterium]